MDWPGPRGQHNNKDLPSIPEFPNPPLSPRREASRQQWLDPRHEEKRPRVYSSEFFDSRTIDDYNRELDRREMHSPSKVQIQEVIRDDSSSESEESKARPSPLLVMSLFISVFLSALDITIITTALPMIAEHLGTNATGFVWIGSAYLLAGAASEPIWAKVSDIFGRKPILMLANAVFLVGSALCAVSVSLKGLIIGRVVQGLGSGGLLVLVNILIGDLWSPRLVPSLFDNMKGCLHGCRERGAYYGLLGMVWAVANTLGPFLGGLFTTKLTWRWCFWVNVPIDGLALVLTAFFLKVHKPHTPLWEGLCAIDWLGSFAVVGGTVSLLLGLEFGGVTLPWDSGLVVTLIVCGIAIWVIFFLIEAHVPKYPLIPLRIFKTVSNLSIIAIDFSHSFVFIAGSYYLPVYFQAVLGANALQSGVYLLPYALSLSITSIGTGYIIKKTGAYLPLISGGMLFLTLGFALFIDFPAKPSWPRIILYQIVAGIGVGPNFQSPMLALQNSVQPHDIGPATATFGFVRQLANAISVVVGGVLLQSQLKGRKTELLEAGIEVRVVELLTGGSAISSVMEIDHLPRFPREIARTAFAASMSKMWLMYACVSIIGLGLPIFIKKFELSTEHKETVTGLEEQERIRLEEEESRAARKAGRGMGVLPDLEDQYDGKYSFEFGGKSAEVLGLSPGHSRPSSRLNGSSKRSRDLEVERDRYYDNKSSREIVTGPPPLVPKKEGALNAARRRSHLRQLSKKMSEGRHPSKASPSDSAEHGKQDHHGTMRDDNSSYYLEEAGWYDDLTDIAGVDLEKVNAKIDEELRMSQSWAKRTDGRNDWMRRVSDPPILTKGGR
jgi:EmrB/QacA subfamily drug resistance transporter